MNAKDKMKLMTSDEWNLTLDEREAVSAVLSENDLLRSDLCDTKRERDELMAANVLLSQEVERLHNKINDLSKVSQDYEDKLRAARDTAEAEADQYKMQLSTALNECLDTVLRENSLIVALNKKDAEIERLRAVLAKIANSIVWANVDDIVVLCRAALSAK